jgi:uncharacterized membrane protein YeaQ/YmgE (transglycosylase-associated protein family)
MGVLSWIVFGLVAGLLARALTPGPNPHGCFVTIAIGIAGAAIGGWIGTQLGFGKWDGFELRSLGLAILGSIVLLLILRALQGPGRPPA